jgi:hypothetical protein
MPIFLKSKLEARRHAFFVFRYPQRHLTFEPMKSDSPGQQLVHESGRVGTPRCGDRSTSVIFGKDGKKRAAGRIAQRAVAPD